MANTEATKSQHRSFPNVDQTDSTSDDVPQRPTTKEVSAMLHEVHPKRSTTPIPLVARMTRNAFSGSADDRKKLNLRSINHGCTPGAEPRTDKVTCSMTTTQETSFDDTPLVSARAPVHDTAAGTVATPGQTEVEALRSFSAPLCTRDGGPEPLGSTFLRGQNIRHNTKWSRRNAGDI